MAKNRSIEQKKLKMKRKGRFARLSGGQSRGLERVGPTPFTEDEHGNTTTKATKMVFVGPISLSKQVMSTGRGPDAVRMQEYYQRVHSYDQSLPETLGLSEPMRAMKARYDEILQETKEMRITLVNNHTGRLDLFFTTNQWFFVDMDLQKKTFKRSRIYGSREYAMKMLKYKSITWVETLPTKVSAGALTVSSRD